MMVWTSLVSALMTLVQSQPTVQPGAGYSFGDFDGDGLVDAYVVRPLGSDALFRNLGDGSFEDVTAIAGLVGIAGTRAALWQDFDGDGFLDLYVSSSRGPSRLLQNAGAGSFVDVTAYAGLATDATGERFAQWLDYDADGQPDLYVAALQGDRLFHNAGSGRFEPVELGGLEGVSAPVDVGSEPAVEGAVEPGVETAPAEDRVLGPRSGPPSLPPEGRPSAPGQRTSAPLLTMPIAPVPPASPVQFCPVGIDDQATANCINASSTPVLGQLYPLSTNLNVSGLGNVGIGTTTPSAKLEVAGTARVTNTLTLAPSGDTALDVSTGSIYKGGALFIHTKGGSRNTAVGQSALNSVTSGSHNTASGFEALRNNTTGYSNTASGYHALRNNVSGFSNVATGAAALASNTIGSFNTASGTDALYDNTIGSRNTASGSGALRNNTTGASNTAIGAAALYYNVGGTRNTATGDSALAFNTAGNDNTASGYAALTSNNTGDKNTASGFEALRLNTTGDFNTASGAQALRNNYTGSYNTASGSLALSSNTTGQRNTALGARALRDNMTGSDNTASGFEALRNNTTGHSNVANGWGALALNTSGNKNTASGFQALRNNTTGHSNVANGFGALTLNTGGGKNTASGFEALRSNTTGTYNTASGFEALRSNTIGFYNTACGTLALRLNTTGNANTATGMYSLRFNTTGNYNTAAGASALAANTTGTDNTVSGFGALSNNTSGSRNIALGKYAGANLTTGNDNIDIGHSGVAAESATIRVGTAGTHTRAFIAGIRGVTTVNANAIPVLVDSAGQLGTVSSSERFKEQIADMGDKTAKLLELRPVVFRYKQQQEMPDGSEVPLEYGLIAEEVAKAFPDLVVYDEEGQPFTVKYHLLSSMLLNELQRLDAAHARQLEELRLGFEARFAALESRASPASLAATGPADGR